MEGFRNQSNLVGRNVEDSDLQLRSVREASAVSQSNLEQIPREGFAEIENLNERNKVGETRMQDLEDQIDQLSRGLLGRKNGVREIKEQTLDVGDTNVGGGEFRSEKFEGGETMQSRKRAIELR